MSRKIFQMSQIFWPSKIKKITTFAQFFEQFFEKTTKIKKLNYVNFCENPYYSKCYSTYSTVNPNATLEEVKNEIFEKFHICLGLEKLT